MTKCSNKSNFTKQNEINNTINNMNRILINTGLSPSSAYCDYMR